MNFEISDGVIYPFKVFRILTQRYKLVSTNITLAVHFTMLQTNSGEFEFLSIFFPTDEGKILPKVRLAIV